MFNEHHVCWTSTLVCSAHHVPPRGDAESESESESESEPELGSVKKQGGEVKVEKVLPRLQKP